MFFVAFACRGTAKNSIVGITIGNCKACGGTGRCRCDVCGGRGEVEPLTEFGTQMTSSQQGASVIRKLTQAQTRLDRSDGRCTL
jgi:hypothetical protein